MIDFYRMRLLNTFEATGYGDVADVLAMIEVREHLKRMGKFRARLIRLVVEGFNDSEIAMRLQVTRSKVSRERYKIGLELLRER